MSGSGKAGEEGLEELFAESLSTVDVLGDDSKTRWKPSWWETILDGLGTTLFTLSARPSEMQERRRILSDPWKRQDPILRQEADGAAGGGIVILLVFGLLGLAWAAVMVSYCPALLLFPLLLAMQHGWALRNRRSSRPSALVEEACRRVESLDDASPQWIERRWWSEWEDGRRVGGVAVYALRGNECLPVLFLSGPLGGGDVEEALDDFANARGHEDLVAAIPMGQDLLERFASIKVDTDQLLPSPVDGASLGATGAIFFKGLLWAVILVFMSLSLQWAETLDDVDLSKVAEWEVPTPLEEVPPPSTLLLARHPSRLKRVEFARFVDARDEGFVLRFLGEEKTRIVDPRLHEIFPDTVSEGARMRFSLSGQGDREVIVLGRSGEKIRWTVTGRSSWKRDPSHFSFSFGDFAKFLPPTPLPRLASRPEVGERVWARWKGKKWFWLAVVKKREGEGFAVTYLDGSSEILPFDALREGRIEVGLRVHALWSADKNWYKGTLLRIGSDDARIRFDDGDEAWIKLTSIRIPE